MASSVGEGRGVTAGLCVPTTTGGATGGTAGDTVRELEITKGGWLTGFCDKKTPVTSRTIPAAAVAKVRSLNHAPTFCHHAVAGASVASSLITPSAVNCARKETHKRSGGFASAGSSWASV